MTTTTSPEITLNNGVTIPQIGFGVFQIPDEQTTAAVAAALRSGYRSIDTAAVYGNETGVGRALADSDIARSEMFITSKVWVTDHGYDATLRAYDASLEKLGLDYLDLYLVHWPAPATDSYLDTWRALDTLASDGRVRAIGVSNFLPEHLQRVIDLGGSLPVVDQIELHPALQQRDVTSFAAAHGIAVEAWSPIAQGAALREPVVRDIASRVGRSPAQVVLRWHLQHGRIIIPKSVTPERMRENLDVTAFELSDGDMALIDSLEADGRTGPHPAAFNG